MSDFVSLTNTKLQQSRDGDAQAIADSLIAEPKSTLIGSLRSSFADTISKQSNAIAQADLAVATVRQNYVSSYSDAKLSLAKVDKVESDLRQLTTPTQVFATVAMFAQVTVTSAENVAQATKKSTGDASHKAKVTPSPEPPASGRFQLFGIGRTP